MQLEWYGWLMLLLAVFIAVGVSWWARGIVPNGELVAWHRHARIKEGYKYVVLALAPSRQSPGMVCDRCALLQDELGLDNPFAVFFPPGFECNVCVGQFVQPIWQDNDKYILYPVPKGMPVAC